MSFDEQDGPQSAAALSAEQIAYLRRVLEVHGNAPPYGQCCVCHQPSCPDWRDAYDRLALAGQLMAEPGRWLPAEHQADPRDPAETAAQPAASGASAVSGTYLAAHVRDQLRQAQRTIEMHVGGPTGRCAACGEVEPCLPRTGASATFARYGRLPLRPPGLTLPNPYEAGFGWLTSQGPGEPDADGVQPRR